MKFPQILIEKYIWRNVFVECQGEPLLAGCPTGSTYYADVIVYCHWYVSIHLVRMVGKCHRFYILFVDEFNSVCTRYQSIRLLKFHVNIHLMELNLLIERNNLNANCVYCHRNVLLNWILFIQYQLVVLYALICWRENVLITEDDVIYWFLPCNRVVIEI